MGTTAKVRKRKPRRRTYYLVGDRFRHLGYRCDSHILCQIDLGVTKLINSISGNRYSDVVVTCVGNRVDPLDFYAAWGAWRRASKDDR